MGIKKSVISLAQDNWEELEIPIGELEHLIKEHDVQIDTPDGFQPISAFVDKGKYPGYDVFVGNKKITVNAYHLFETEHGWAFAKDIADNNTERVLTETGYQPIQVIKTDIMVDIVDIQVDHPNHRYWADGLSSHNTNVGKTIFMCDCAANHLLMGKNVLYITLEMSEQAIGKRIDANLLNICIDDIESIPKDIFDKKIARLKEKTTGKLIVKEYPTGSAHVGHFRHLIQELKLKKKFIPDIIYVDYINICSSAKIKKTGDSSGGYYYIKSIAEELRGLAGEANVPIMSATQLNRSGFSDSDPDMASTSESFALPMTLDFMAILTVNEALEALNQVQVKQVKSRFGSKSKKTKFVIGLDLNHMRFHDVEESAQTLVNSKTEADDIEVDEKEERIRISKKQGSEAYKPGYSQLKLSRKKKTDFSDFKI